MVEFTLFELHLHDGVEFSPRGVLGDVGESLPALVGGDESERAAESASVERTDDESGGTARTVLSAVAGLAFLGGVAYGVRRLRREVDVELEVEDVEEIVD